MRSAEVSLELGTVVAGRYRVLGGVGRGGMGVVYRVEHIHTGEQLALKVLGASARLDPQAIARFKREARTSSRIKSEHVVRVLDADTAPELDGGPFLVMELLVGTDLEKHVVAEGALSPETLIAFLAQVASVLDAAHALGIVHRDLKPENLFLHRRDDGSLVAKVLDFGISKIVSSDGTMETAGKTSAGAVVGTPFYMAPEQAHGENEKIGPSTDVWAMGLVAIRLLTAGDYWDASSMADLMMKLAVKPIVPPSVRWPTGKHMSPALDAWFLRSCHRDQKARFGSVGAQVAALAEALGGIPVGPIPQSTPSTRDAVSAPSPVVDPIALAATTPANIDTVASGDEALGLVQSRAQPAQRSSRVLVAVAIGAVGILGFSRLAAKGSDTAPSSTSPPVPSLSVAVVGAIPSSSSASVITPEAAPSVSVATYDAGAPRHTPPVMPTNVAPRAPASRPLAEPTPRASASMGGVWTER